MNNDLFKAILAMDSYNRGYNEGIKLTEGDDVVGTLLGGATVIRQSDYEAGDPGFVAGFYAIAYEYQGEVIVTYRGLDERLSLTSKDKSHGFGVGGGDADTEQSRMAIEFYQAIVNRHLPENETPDPNDYYGANGISFAGHSMGGGLAETC